MSRGFGLIELLMTVTVLVIVGAIAVPNYLAMVQSARETTVIAFLKQWPQAEELFNTAYGGYTDDPEELVDEGFISGTVGAGGATSGYVFGITLGPSVPDATGSGKGKGKGKGKGGSPPSFSTQVAWWGTAEPASPDPRARYFYVDSTGLIVAKVGGSPKLGDKDSKPLGT